MQKKKKLNKQEAQLLKKYGVDYLQKTLLTVFYFFFLLLFIIFKSDIS